MSWSDATLESAPLEIIDGDRGKNYPKQFDFFDEGHCLFLSTTNVTTDGFRFDDCQFITESKDAELRKGKLQRNDIVLTTRGTLGNCAYYADSVRFDHIRINSGMVIVRVDEKELYAPFVYSFFRSEVFQKQVEGLRSGAAQPQLPIRDLKRVKLKYPSLDEQKRIAFVIANYDDLIENNKRRIALLEESARLLYREWFVHFRFPGHEHVKIIDGLPEGWSRTSIANISQTIGGGTPSTKKPEYWDDGDVVWFSPTDLTNNGSVVLLDSAKKITTAGLQKSSAKLLPPRTILMTSRASIGYFGVFEGIASTNQGFISVIPNDENLRWYLLHNLWNRVDEIKSLAGGATFKEINKTTFRALEVIVPSEIVLKVFHEFYSDIYQQLINLTRQNQKLIQARDILLPRLMNGDLAV